MMAKVFTGALNSSAWWKPGLGLSHMATRWGMQDGPGQVLALQEARRSCPFPFRLHYVDQSLVVLVVFSKEIEPVGDVNCIDACREIYYKESAHMMVETEVLQCALCKWKTQDSPW